MTTVVLDTNVLVAAGFNRDSASADILRLARQGELRIVWDQATLDETRQVIGRIPPLQWQQFQDLFKGEHQFTGGCHPEALSVIADPQDRKFAALAQAADALLISSDDHLLGVRDQLPVTVLTPRQFIDRFPPPQS